MTKINQDRDDAPILQMPRKTHLSSDSRNASRCRLYGYLGRYIYCNKSPQEDELHTAAEAVY